MSKVTGLKARPSFIERCTHTFAPAKCPYEECGYRDALDEIERLQASEAEGISIFNEAVWALKDKTAEIDRLNAELAAARENAVSDRVKLEAALEGHKAALERCVGYTRELREAREDSERLDFLILWLNRESQYGACVNRWHPTKRTTLQWDSEAEWRGLLDVARKESR